VAGEGGHSGQVDQTPQAAVPIGVSQTVDVGWGPRVGWGECRAAPVRGRERS